jgi:exodeoxyribonuclease VII small subunit
MSINFETAMEQLEEIVKRLESGELGLDESLALFQKGIGLVRFCEKTLDDTTGKIEKLVRQETGELTVETFEVGEAS